MIIIYGGSFNPPTIAHKKIIEFIQNKYNCKIIIVPVSKKNYHFKNNLLDDNIRVDLLNIMTRKMNNVLVSRFEIDQDKYYGTLFVLNYYKNFDRDIYLLIGSDNFNKITSWINYEQILLNYKLIVIKRGVLDTKLYTKYKKNITLYDDIDYVSSSLVRKDFIKNKKYLDEEVFKYLKKINLKEWDNE